MYPMQDTHRIRMGNLGVEVVVSRLPQPTHLTLMCMTYLPLPHALGSYLYSVGRKKLVLQPRSKPIEVCMYIMGGGGYRASYVIINNHTMD